MAQTTFTYSKTKEKKQGLIFLAVAIIGAVLALYMWLYANPILLQVLVGGVFLFLIGIAFFLKPIFAPQSENKVAITISEMGITATTTPIVKAAGLILWEDIEEIMLSASNIELTLKHPDKYAKRMHNFFVRDSFLKSLKGRILISYLETNASYPVLKNLLE